MSRKRGKFVAETKMCLKQNKTKQNKTKTDAFTVSRKQRMFSQEMFLARAIGEALEKTALFDSARMGKEI